MKVTNIIFLMSGWPVHANTANKFTACFAVCLIIRCTVYLCIHSFLFCMFIILAGSRRLNKPMSAQGPPYMFSAFFAEKKKLSK